MAKYKLKITYECNGMTAIEIKELVEEMGEVAIRGKILAVDTRELRNGQSW